MIGGVSYVHAQATTTAPTFTNTGADFANLNCGFGIPGVSTGTPNGCLALGVYYLIYKPISWILIFVVYLFDATLSLSISNQFINRPFINDLWVLIRNFSNMIFIFVLIYTGIQTMLGIGNWRKTVLNVVVIALLINFSLFFTKVVIDAGNVLAVGVYSSMGLPATTGIKTNTGDVEQRGVATTIAGQFQPQAFLGQAGTKALDTGLDAIVIFMVAAVISGAAAYIFFKAMLLFLGRVIAFWYLMIISPFAFTSIVLPKGANIFDSWTSLLLEQTFMAPVFLFLIYMIMQVVTAGGGLLNGIVNSSSEGLTGFMFDKLIVPVIMAAMIFIALQKALKVAEKMAGDFGGAISKYVGQAVGTVATVAVGAATGGAAMAAGAAGKAALASGGLQEAAMSSNVFKRSFGKLGLLAADKAQTATFDPRNISAVASGAKKIGLDLGKGSKMTYESQTKKWREPQEKRQMRLAELVEMSSSEKAAMTAKAKQGAFDAANNLAYTDQLVGTTAVEAEKKKAELGLQEKEKVVEVKLKEKTEAEKNEVEALDRLTKVLSSNIVDANGKRNGEDEARATATAATATAAKANTEHTQARTQLADSKSAYETSEEAKKLKDLQERQATQKEIVKEKNKAVAEISQTIATESNARREIYAQQVERGSIGSKSALERAEKIRKNGPEERAKNKKRKERLKEFAEVVEEGKEEKPKPEEKKTEKSENTPKSA